MNAPNNSRSRTNSFASDPGYSGSLSQSAGIVERLKQNKQSSDFMYEDLCENARPGGIVKLEQEQQFFVITHPSKLNSFSWNSPYLGWKIHLSVHPDDVVKSFNLINPILIQFKLGFKVVNLKEIGDERFLQGQQITIYRLYVEYSG